MGSPALNAGLVLPMWVGPPSDNLTGLGTQWTVSSLVPRLVSPLSGVQGVQCVKEWKLEDSSSHEDIHYSTCLIGAAAKTAEMYFFSFWSQTSILNGKNTLSDQTETHGDKSKTFF